MNSDKQAVKDDATLHVLISTLTLLMNCAAVFFWMQRHGKHLQKGSVVNTNPVNVKSRRSALFLRHSVSGLQKHYINSDTLYICAQWTNWTIILLCSFHLHIWTWTITMTITSGAPYSSCIGLSYSFGCRKHQTDLNPLPLWVTVLPGREAHWLSHEAAIQHIISTAASFLWPVVISLAIHTQQKLSQAFGLLSLATLIKVVTRQILWATNLPSSWFQWHASIRQVCERVCVSLCTNHVRLNHKEYKESTKPASNIVLHQTVHFHNITLCDSCTFTVNEALFSATHSAAI